MKPRKQPWKTLAGLMAVTLTFVGAATSASAATLSLNGQVFQRPLTPTEVSQYALTNVQPSAGINTVGVGEPVYLDALVNISLAPSNIVGVTWTLTNKPSGSLAAISAGPLGTNVPVYNPADRRVSRLAGRSFFRPDVVGQYTVRATITTTGMINGTNIAPTTTNIVKNFTAATYLGLGACAACHSGSFIGVPSIYPNYTNTAHASFFTRAIDGKEGYYSQGCISCHVVGYDTNSFANNGGFDDMAEQLNWTFPATLTNGNWAAMPAQLQYLANIQCENCHGPGSQHMFSQGITGNTNATSISYAAGDCNRCHDATPYHTKTIEWNNSRHAIATRTPSGPTRPACVRCHTAPGFIEFVNHAGMTNTFSTNTVYEAITCQACHDPHDATNLHQLRSANSYTLPEGTTVTNAGFGALCMECHHSRNGSATNNIAKYQLNQPTWAGGVAFGVHDSTAGDMIEGVNGITYGQVIPSGSHSAAISNVCVGCHMQPVASSDPAYGQAGGHTFSMTYTNGAGETLDKIDVCVKCHGPIEDFNMVRKDYNGDGVIEGIQTEVQKLLDKLSTLLPGTNYYANPSNYVADGLVKTSISTKTNWPVQFLNAAWNWQFVEVEGSMGIHNAPYAVGLLKASIADLTGDSNNDGLPDDWQISYFGSTTNDAAAPGAINNTNGIPNWMMYALGLDPHSGSTTINGVIYFNGKNIVNGATNTIAIYTAAEVVFDTEIGKTYTIQGITALTGDWQNISTNIPGTGTSVSYVTPTRDNVQMFYRVVHSP
jgi:hypothetical protein